MHDWLSSSSQLLRISFFIIFLISKTFPVLVLDAICRCCRQAWRFCLALWFRPEFHRVSLRHASLRARPLKGADGQSGLLRMKMPGGNAVGPQRSSRGTESHHDSYPPSTVRMEPCAQSETGAARYSTAPAISSGLPHCLEGTRSRIFSERVSSAWMPAVKLVRT